LPEDQNPDRITGFAGFTRFGGLEQNKIEQENSLDLVGPVNPVNPVYL
jgi:hypothetical protein